MWLLCAKDLGREPESVPGEEAWPCGEALHALWELNEQCLELLAEQSAAPGASAPLLQGLQDLWRQLDESDRARAARCPYLLLDAGFATGQWSRRASPQIAEQSAPERLTGRPGGAGGVGGAGGAGGEHRVVHGRDGEQERPFFTVPRVLPVAQQIYSTAWYLARTHPIGVSLFLGMSPSCASHMRESTLRQIAQLAEREGPWLQPRWGNALHLWRALLEAARGKDSAALDRARLQGVQLLAAQLRTLDQTTRGRTVVLQRRSLV